MNKLRILTIGLLMINVLPVIGQDRSMTIEKDMAFQDALNLAAKNNKKVFVDFYAVWCGPCKVMDKEVFTENSVADYMNAGFVNLKLDAEKGEGLVLAKKYKVTAYPTFIVFDSKGNEATRFMGSMKPDRFIAKMKQGLDPLLTPAALADRYTKGERTPQLINDYAYSVLESKTDKEGFEIIDGYFNSLSAADKLKPENSFLFTRYTIDFDDLKAKYLYNNRASFYKSLGKDQTQQILYKLLRLKAIPYASGFNFKNGKYDAATYQQLKKDILTVGFPKILSIDGLLRIIDARITEKPEVFVAVLEKEFPTLNNRDQFIMMMNLPALKEANDPALNKRALSLLRSYLAIAPGESLKVIGKVVEDFE